MSRRENSQSSNALESTNSWEVVGAASQPRTCVSATGRAEAPIYLLPVLSLRARHDTWWRSNLKVMAGIASLLLSSQ